MKQFSLDEYLKNPQRRIVTRKGASVRIICTDKVCNKKVSQKPIIALVDFGDREIVYPYSSDGISSSSLPELDLFFASEKKEGWVNVYRHPDLEYPSCVCIYPTYEEAVSHGKIQEGYVTTTKIEWEE